MNRLSRWTLPNGLNVLYQQDPSFPLACASLLMRAGSRLETPVQAGLSSMSIDLLMQGTRRHDAKEIARQMELIGASMGTQAHEDYSEMGFIAPAKEMRQAFGMMAEILKEPAFPQDEIKKERAHILAGLRSRKDAIFHLAYDHFSKALFSDHPYGRPLEGSADTVRRFNRQDFLAWNARHSSPEGAILSIVAPLPPTRALEWLKKSLGAWVAARRPKGSASAPQRVATLQKSMRKVVQSNFKQAYLMTGWQAPSAHHEDQMILKVLNTVLGGGMSSLLFVKLREELGLAYEVSSFYPTRFDLSQWVIYLGLPAERLAVASKRLEQLLEDLARKGPHDREMQQAKAMIRGAFLMDRQSRRRQGWYNGWWEFTGRGLDYGKQFLRGVDAVSATQVRDLLRTFLEKPRVTVKVVPQ